MVGGGLGEGDRSLVMKATFSDITAGSNSARLRLAGSANGNNPVYTLNAYEAGTFSGEFTINTAGTYYMIFAPNWSSSTVVNSYKASDILVCTKNLFCIVTLSEWVEHHTNQQRVLYSFGF